MASAAPKLPHSPFRSPSPPFPPDEGRGTLQSEMRRRDACLLWIAEGFGSGRLRPGPGTWGSVVGTLLAWGIVQLPAAAAVSLTLALTVVAVPVCAAGERLLGRKDPGSVVFDEIVAMPWVFLPVTFLWAGSAPPRSVVGAWPLWIAGFILFRVFDIAKPWPIRPLQRFHGGFGVVVDDIAAGLIAGGLLCPLSRLLPIP